MKEIEHQPIPPIAVRPGMFPLAGLLFGFFIWVIDALVDVYILEEEQTLLENIVMPDESTELWMRSLVVVVFIIMGFFSRHVLLKHMMLDRLLLDYQKRLEDIVTERTQKLIDKTRELEVLASCDTLTGLYNRRKFSEILQHELKRFERYQQSFSLINIDIDHFKKINDTYGHDAGDRVISQFAHILDSSIRGSDSAGRWGGEEFILLIIESSESTALNIAEKLRETFNNTRIDPAGIVTASIGVTHVKDGDTEESIIIRSDQALYKAKDNGRNRIESL